MSKDSRYGLLHPKNDPLPTFFFKELKKKATYLNNLVKFVKPSWCQTCEVHNVLALKPPAASTNTDFYFPLIFLAHGQNLYRHSSTGLSEPQRRTGAEEDGFAERRAQSRRGHDGK